MAAIMVAESLATGKLSTGRFHWFDDGKIAQWLSGGMVIGGGVGLAVGLGVGFGVGALVGAVVGPAAGTPGVPGLGFALGPDRPVADGLKDGALPNELPGATVANVPGARPAAIAWPDGVEPLDGEAVGPSADGAQAAISAPTSSTPTAIEGRVRFMGRG